MKSRRCLFCFNNAISKYDDFVKVWFRTKIVEFEVI